MKNYLLTVIMVLIHLTSFSQVIEPNLQDTTQWEVVNRRVTPINENGKKGISFNELPNAGYMILKESEFSNATIELDIKGNDKFQQSFVGFAFHGQDVNVYDAIYFRPFNFKSDDAMRRSHAVQYISMPSNDWEKLRNEFPGKYENKVEPAPGPNDWFHTKIVVNGKKVTVFVNDLEKPVLEVEKLNSYTNGGFALWVGNNSGGSFANLKITKSTAGSASTQNTPYGNNASAPSFVVR